MSQPEWELVRETATGRRSDYRLDHRPLAEAGGQGIVFRAVHKPSGIEVAMKKVRDHTDDGIARMRREIDVASDLYVHRHVMPVLDASPAWDWFVMPLAKGSAADRHIDLGRDACLRPLVTAVCEGLAAAHMLEWVHRDVKPANVLYLDGRWVLADWGLGRRPRGETSMEGRTRTGMFLGTERFAAPELADNAHDATFAADVYSVGQLIGWAVTGKLPAPFTPLIPDSGAWRAVVRAATQHNAARRPQTVQELVDLIEAELNEPPAVPANAGERLLEQVHAGDGQAEMQLWRLAVRHSDDYDLYIEVLADVPHDAIERLSAAEPELTREVVKAVHTHLDDTGARNLPFAGAGAIVKLLLVICRHAGREENWTLLEEAVDAMLAWDAVWDQWNARDAIIAWMRGVNGEVARIVASALRQNQDGRPHFEALGQDRNVDGRLRAALSV